MSAIAGIYNIDNEHISDEHIHLMMSRFQPFPADDIQVFKMEQIFMGCHAQWITPESIGEKLPLYDSLRKLVITADAIIDNRSELMNRLKINHHNQKNITDSQLILLAYAKWEEETPKHLIGDFVFVIWDIRKQRLFAARDFSGSRTLYYHYQDNRLAFATTIDSVLSLPNINKDLNKEWLAEYLAISGVVDVADVSSTPYKAIAQLPPAHYLIVEKGSMKKSRYSHLSEEIKPVRYSNSQDYVDAFLEVYQSAIQARLRTFKKVGSQLSGGLDSGSVVSIARKNMDTDLTTFSYTPPKDFQPYGPKNLLSNETPYIKSTVEFVGGINDYYLAFEGKDSYSDMDTFLETMEMPYKFFENSFWINGIYEQAQKQDIGILLNGNRGNLSISWGSPQDYYPLLLKRLNWIKLYQEVAQFSKRISTSRSRVANLVIKEALPTINKNNNQGVLPLINPDFAKKMNVYDKLHHVGIGEAGWFTTNNAYEHRKRHFDDLFHWNATNTFSSKLSLKYGLISRDPTNDLRVIRYCLSIPEDQYVQNGMDRALIRRAMKEFLPDKVRLNQQVRGAQGKDWAHRMLPKWDLFVEESREMFSNKDISPYLNKAMLKIGLEKAESEVRTDFAVDRDIRLLMRSVIFYRFMKKFI
ncbi:asparagine synthase-related protein [Bacillus sp. B1-b2]|uniref:asparagine synthase-related protein n=1 Tax=Bacillus sp. B1-b2 TaxID=2653201 RepID=UPI00126159D0|nr:asparagine synthase-related protein [Bacillus sp. B1-b2]KAB7671712.1 asparagine synthetase B [Bacillus sp. B1-b2]